MNKLIIHGKHFLWALTILLGIQTGVAQTEAPFSEQVQDTTVRQFPKPLGFVSDFENVFTKEQIESLEAKLANYESETSREIAVVTVSSLEDYENIETFSMELANEWGIGKKDTDNGLLLLFSKNLRQIRISTGTKTQESLPDDMCRNIINRIILPQFMEGDFYGGVKQGVEVLMAKWE